MPIYCYACKNCEKEFEQSSMMADREKPLEVPCEHCGGQLYIAIKTNFELVDPMRLGIRKPSEAFNDRLREMKKKHPLGNINIR